MYQDRVNILESIANAGDITQTGDRKDVLILRQYPQGQKIHHIDLTDMAAMKSEFYYIQPNDLILINPLPQKSSGFGVTGLASFTTILALITSVTSSILLFISL